MIELDWNDLQKTIIHYTFIDPWTWDEYYKTNPKRDMMLSTIPHVVDIILDFRRGKHIPSQAMTHFRKAAAWDNPQRGIVVIIGVHSMLQSLANIMMRVYPQAALKAPRPAKDIDEARGIIAEVRQKREKNLPIL